MVDVGAPGNPVAAIVPFQDAIFPTCTQSGAGNCIFVGAVGRRYRIGRLEVTVRQRVEFLLGDLVLVGLRDERECGGDRSDDRSDGEQGHRDAKAVGDRRLGRVDDDDPVGVGQLE